MKAPKLKGYGWDVFHVGGTWPDHGTHEIERIDDPGVIDEKYTKPAFSGDYPAIRHVIFLAKRGNKTAIDALWTCWDDPGVHKVLWEGFK